MSFATLTRLPQPSRAHATCAWCRGDFVTIVELIDHVDNAHTPILDAYPAKPPRAGAGRLPHVLGSLR
jgi:hypothetical protein